ncbi:MAG: hypothetical protein OXC08_01570 [Thiotrichales bacterium]|nr:hypothetical protein [Thiotrichales bacterium]
MMPGDASETYEVWRRLWLSGEDSNAIAALRFHGLRGALAIAGGARNSSRSRLPSAPAISTELSIADAVIAEAASQVRRLLNASSASMIGVGENRENQYV